jgi:hypothetical protein
MTGTVPMSGAIPMDHSRHQSGTASMAAPLTMPMPGAAQMAPPMLMPDPMSGMTGTVTTAMPGMMGGNMAAHMGQMMVMMQNMQTMMHQMQGMMGGMGGMSGSMMGGMDHHAMMGMMHQMMGDMHHMMGMMHGMMGGGMMGGGMMGGQGMGMMGPGGMSGSMMGGMSGMGGGQAQIPAAAAGSAAGGVAVETGLARTGRAGEIEVSVTPRNLGETGAATLAFDVVLDTHSGELPANLDEMGMLHIGGVTLSAESWEPEGEGHHVTGVLTFSLEGEEAQQALAEGVEAMLMLHGLGGANPTFHWDLP